MVRIIRAAAFAAGIAVASAAAVAAHADSEPLSLRSFGASQAISSYELSAAGMAGFALQSGVTAPFPGNSLRLNTAAYGTPLTLYSPSFATSVTLSSNLALDAGAGLDLASRFNSYDGTQSPFMTPVDAPFLGLANGGRYSGVTFVPTASLRARLGASLNDQRLDRFAFDPVSVSGDLALAFDPSQTRSLLAGLSWDASNWLNVDVSGITALRTGVPLGFEAISTIAPRAQTNALGVSAHMGLGSGWVTTASFNEGSSQLDLRGSGTSTVREQSYAITVAKHGLFGDDTLGLSFSRPAPSLTGSFSSLIGATGDLPPTIITSGQALGNRAPETDLQLGYVTNFLNGAVALQANAAYQMNSQGQQGANSVAVLSRAKIKF